MINSCRTAVRNLSSLPPYTAKGQGVKTSKQGVLLKVKPKICFVVTPCEQKGGGMGRVKDYILEAGNNRSDLFSFVALDSRGNGSALGSVFFVLSAIARIWFCALTGRLALVHVNMAERGSLLRKSLVILASRITGKPIVLHLHAAKLIRDYRTAGPVVRSLIALPFKMATCSIVLGVPWSRWLIHDLKIDPQKIEIVYNGVPVHPVGKPVASGGEKVDCSFLFLGNLGERKGLSDFLNALALLPKNGPSWNAVIAGGGDTDFYKKLAESLGLSSRVVFTGWVDRDRATAYLREADVLVLPSYEEGLPLVILEALGHGVVVIATPVGAIPEALGGERAAILVDPGDRQALAEKMSDLLRAPSLREALSKEGVRLYQDRFTLERFADTLFSVYRHHCKVDLGS